jgi:hypothetical protein
MFGRQIFRNTSLEKLQSTDDLDSLLQINSSRSWLMLSAILVSLAGVIAWGVFGSIAQTVTGFGILRTHDMPHIVVAACGGQVDSLRCDVGDSIVQNAPLMCVARLDGNRPAWITSPIDGCVVGVMVREGEYVETGQPLLEIEHDMRLPDIEPEAVIFVSQQDLSRIRTGMQVELQVDNSGAVAGPLQATIRYICSYPASPAAMLKYFPGRNDIQAAGDHEMHEVRASLIMNNTGQPAPGNEGLLNLNGLSCRAAIMVARRSPIALIFQ